MNGFVLYKSPQYEDSYEVSRIVKEGESLGVEIGVYAPAQFDLVVSKEVNRVLVDNVDTKTPNFFLPRMGSGTNYFALAIIRHMENLGCRVLNSSRCIEMVKDKLWSIQVLSQANIPIPKTVLMKVPFDVSQIESTLSYPVVLKALSGSHGKGVFLCDGRETLIDVVELISHTQSTANFILQEFISSSRGKDIRVITIGGRAIGAMLRESVDGSFKANISRGGKAKEFVLNPEVEWLSTETSRVLGMDVAGVDLLFDGERYVVCEANSSPGFVGFETATGVNVAKQMIEFALLVSGSSSNL